MTRKYILINDSLSYSFVSENILMVDGIEIGEECYDTFPCSHKVKIHLNDYEPNEWLEFYYGYGDLILYFEDLLTQEEKEHFGIF